MAPLLQQISRRPDVADPKDANLNENITTADGASSQAQRVAQNDGPAPPDDQAVDEALSPPLEQLEKDFPETEYEAADLVMRTKYNYLGKNTLENERKLGRLGLRSKQASLHQYFMAMRVDELETKFKDIEAIIYDKKDSLQAKGKAKEKLPVHLHAILRSNKSDFRPSQEALLLAPEQQPALEVQLSDWSTVSGASKRTTSNEPQAKLETPSPAADSASKNTPDTKLLTPERLRIRSRPLLHHLEQVCGMPMFVDAKITKMGEFEEKKVYNGFTFLRPFKLFVKYEEAIRRSLVDLTRDLDEKNLGEENPESEATNLGGTVKDPRPLTGGVLRYDRKDLLIDLRLLIEFFDQDLRPTFDLRRQIKEGTATEIAYADLWHLFERGDYVVTASSQSHGYMVLNYAGGRERLGKIAESEDTAPTAPLGGFVVDCVSIGSDGSSYVPKVDNITIQMFLGTKPISSLPVYPLRFDPSANELRSKFIHCGQKFLEVTSKPFVHLMVRGKTVDEPSYDLDDQVIVDTTLAIDAMPEWRLTSRVSVDDLTQRDQRETISEHWCNHYMGRYGTGEGCCGADVLFKDLKIDDEDADAFISKTGTMMVSIQAEELTEESLVAIRPFVHAFVLRSRRWVTVRVEDLHEVEFENSFKDLVLPSNDKATVQALVQTHHNTTAISQGASLKTSSVGAALDIVKGKGRGLIILLHGPPGVGKTSTAECVADDTKKPLFPITCGDLGETAADVENSLQNNFRLAHKWGCVLLLDEADIFLAKRTKSDLRHNAVTSVFLRSLEYYAGILFLTTNRVGVMDPAFKSRVQLSLAYHTLNLDVTCKLYEKFIKRAKAEQERTNTYNFKIKEKEILKFAKRHFKRLQKEGYDTWNGRQIRNAFQTAIALAEHTYLMKQEDEPNPMLGKEQFETVAEGLRAFDRYLVLAHGFTESESAKQEGVRDDSFTTLRPSSTATPTPSTKRTTARGGLSPRPEVRTTQYSNSSDSESDSDSEDDSDDDGDDSNDPKRAKKAKAKSGGAVDLGGASEASGTNAGQVNQMEQFQQFLKWQKMQ